MKKIALLFIFFIIFSIFASRAGSHRVFFPIDAGLSNFNVPTQTTCFGSLQTISVLLANAGTTPIGTGSATVFLKIGGANYFSATANNSTTIPGNGAEWIYFTGVNMSNPGTNFDSVYVMLPGDLSHGNDSLFANNLSAFTIGSFPADEKFDAGSMIFGYSKMINGGINLTRLQTGMYTNPALGGTLAPHSGNNFMLFDNYTGNNTAGVVNRLYSDCFVLPVSGTGACSYKLGFWMSHDASQSTKADSLYVTVSADHGISWVRQGQGFSRYNSSFILSGWKKELIDLSGFAGQVIQIGFEDVSRSGNIIGLDDITVGSVAVQNISLNTIASNSIPLQKACDDQGWTYYVDPSIPGQYLLGIQWDPSAAGANLVAKNLAIPHLQLDAQHFAIEDIVAKKATYTMKRYWNVNLNGTTLSSPVNLRYFYDSVEKAEVDNKAFNFAAANNGFLETGLWFKTLSGDFSSDAVHVTLDGVTNAMSLVNSNAASNKMNNVAYVQFNGITSFSGGTYASGVGPNSLVPLNLLNFNIQRSGKVNLISWSTAQEVNTDYFSVEHSIDGRNFSSIGQLPAAGNSTNVHTYNFMDVTPFLGINYYRLRLVDKDHSIKFSVIRSVRNEGIADVDIYPNPAIDILKVYIAADKNVAGSIHVYSLDGKEIYSKSMAVNQGVNIFPLTVSNMARGYYLIRVILGPDDFVIRKFNKL